MVDVNELKEDREHALDDIKGYEKDLRNAIREANVLAQKYYERKVQEAKLKLEAIDAELKDEGHDVVKEATKAVRKEKLGKAWDTTKKVGRGARSVGSGMVDGARDVGSGMASGAGLMGNLGVKGVKKVHNWAHGGADKSLLTLFWIAVIIQLIDVFLLRFNRTIYFATSIAMYGALILLAWWFFSKSSGNHFANPRQIILFVMISGFYIIVPSLLYAVPKIHLVAGTTLFDWVSFLLAILPIWPIYIGFKADIPFVHKYVNFWIIFLLFVFIFGVGFSLKPGDVVGIGGRPELVQAGVVATYLWEKTTDIAKNFWKSLSLIPAAKRLLNASGINYYTGMIDNNEQAPVGLYIDNVRPADKYFYAGYPVIIWADLRGKSFMEEIQVSPICYIDKGAAGERDPESISILGEEHATLSCIFYDLAKGSYLAKVGATFNFETWAYVTYTFVDIDTKRALEIQGKNVNQELDVSPLPNAVYTNGPAMLGMASMVNQPIGIDTMYNTREPILGVTLDNLWSEGIIEHVEEFTIQVPDDFKLVKCDRWRPETEKPPFKSEEGYDFYRFSKQELGDVRSTFQSITCRLQVKDPAALLAGAQKVQRTFVAQTKYLYKIEKSQRIYVRE